TARPRSTAPTCGATTSKRERKSPSDAKVIVHRAGYRTGPGGRGRARFQVLRRDGGAGRRLAGRQSRRVPRAGRPERGRKIDARLPAHGAHAAGPRLDPPRRRERPRPGRSERLAGQGGLRVSAVDGGTSADGRRERLPQPTDRRRGSGGELAADAGGGPRTDARMGLRRERRPGGGTADRRAAADRRDRARIVDRGAGPEPRRG